MECVSLLGGLWLTVAAVAGTPGDISLTPTELQLVDAFIKGQEGARSFSRSTRNCRSGSCLPD
jgi:hypothetical protein